uniref:Alcohol dehydrogenase-like N-terminal domain-containing protein n=1 Tax=Panagrolaimus sp. ES5 TaxID=591445 RepID=A0AC34F7L4_9BILA
MSDTIETIKTAITELVFTDNQSDNVAQCDTVIPAEPQKWSTEKKMHCLIWNGKSDIQYVEHPRPIILDPRDVILRITATTISESDLHLYNGIVQGMKAGDIPGGEFMGIVEEIGEDVKKIKKGQRVIASFSFACGECRFCKEEEYALCDETNPCKILDENEQLSDIQHLTGPAPGGQSEYVRVGIADINCFSIPDKISDEKALFLTDVIPTTWHATVMGRVKKGDTVGIWGLGPAGLICAKWCQIIGAKMIIGIDNIPERLNLAKAELGIEVINFQSENVCTAIKNRLQILSGLDVGILTGGFDSSES